MSCLQHTVSFSHNTAQEILADSEITDNIVGICHQHAVLGFVFLSDSANSEVLIHKRVK